MNMLKIMAYINHIHVTYSSIESVSTTTRKKYLREKMKWINVVNHNFGFDHAKGINTETWEDAPR